MCLQNDYKRACVWCLMINHVARFLITASIVSKHRDIPKPLDGLIVHHPVHQYLRNALANPGVFVHWSVNGSGKTVSVLELTRSLKTEGRTVVLLNGYSMVHGNLMHLLRQSIGRPNSYTDPISSFTSGSSLTIIIDDFSPVMSKDGVYDFLHTLASDSALSGRFNVLLCVTAFEWAVDILSLRWDDCPAVRLVGFPGCGRWSELHLRELVTQSPENHETLISTSAESGIPPFACRIRDPIERRTLDMEWRKGVQALSQLSPDAFTIPMSYDDVFIDGLGSASYPDKNGMFTLT